MTELAEAEIKALVEAARQQTWGAKIFPYEERWQDKAASDGTNEHDFAKVDPRRTRVITHMAAYNDVSACTFIYLKHNVRGVDLVDAGAVAPLIGEVVNLPSPITLGADDYMLVSFEGCTSGDDLYAVVNGYEIIL